MIGIDYSSLDLNKRDEYKLSSMITGDNLLFAITRLSDNKILQVKELSGLKEDFYLDFDYISNIFIENNLFRENITEVAIGFFTKDFSIIPKSIFNNKIKNYNSLLNSVKQYLDDFEIQKSYIKSIDSFCFFPFPKSLDKLLKDNFKNVSIHHSNDSLISNDNIDAKDFVLVNFHQNLIQTVVFRDNAFVQTNVYEIKTKEDILYFVLLNLKNAGLPLNLVDVYLSGRVYEESAIYKLLYEHIKNLCFVDNLNRTNFSNVFLGKPKHLFYDIYSLSQCV